MSKIIDNITSLLDEQYFLDLRNAIIQQGNINVRALARNFGILDGNTYFRNFIENPEGILGISGLSSILASNGYQLRLVPVKVADDIKIEELQEYTRDVFRNICIDVSEQSKKCVKTKKIKSEIKTIPNSNIIFDDLVAAADEDLMAGIF